MRELVCNGVTLRLVQADITKISADAIVNAANSGLRGGGGVDGAIHRAGGPTIMAECRALGGCPTGEARITSAGNLPARYVIHAVGPVWNTGMTGVADLLASAYRSSFALARDYQLASIALPSISTGLYGYPIEQAAPVALATARAAAKEPGTLRDITFVLFSVGDLHVSEQALGALAAEE